MSTIEKLLEERILVLDGAMGTMLQRYAFKEEDFRYAIKMYENAIEIDPGFTLAWVGLAASSRFLYWFNYERSEDWIAQTKQYLDHAFTLNSELVEVQLEKAIFLYQCERNYNGALKVLNRIKTK